MFRRVATCRGGGVQQVQEILQCVTYTDGNTHSERLTVVLRQYQCLGHVHICKSDLAGLITSKGNWSDGEKSMEDPTISCEIKVSRYAIEVLFTNMK